MNIPPLVFLTNHFTLYSDGKVTPAQIYLVPQKVYSVRGSLADQITYPNRIEPEDRTEEDEKELMDLLELVRVAYLVEREGGWDAFSKWEDTLSLGGEFWSITNSLNICILSLQ